MKTNRILANVAAVGLLLTMCSGAYAQKHGNPPHVVTVYCSGCHGLDGNAQLPYFPKLGGLDATYAEKKITAFKEPDSPPVDEMFSWLLHVAAPKKTGSNVTHMERVNMEGVAHAAKPGILHHAVVWYAAQAPARGRAGDKALIEQGKDIFANGVSAEKIVPCMTCHGADAEGTGVAPRLAGQNAVYIEGQLDKFRKGDRTHAPEMTMVTRDLNTDQAHAAAVFLQSK
jgi:cytochrome c553